MHILTTLFKASFFALFFILTVGDIRATQDLPYTNIPEDMAETLTARITALPPVSKGEEIVIRHATPQNYTNAGPELEKNKSETAPLVDRVFYQLNADHTIFNCLLALLGTSHPNAFLREEEGYLERAYAVFKRADDDQETHIGFIHTAPGMKGGRQIGLTKLDYTLFHEHRGQGYATPMIRGFKEYLQGLQGQQLRQFTLPNSDQCEIAIASILDPKIKMSFPNFTQLAIQSKSVSFTEVQIHVSLENPNSFIAAYRAGFHLVDVQQIWESDSAVLKALVKESDVPSGENLDDLRQRLNKVLVFSNVKPMSIEDHLKTYVDAGREGREAVVPDLAQAIMDETVSHILLPN